MDESGPTTLLLFDIDGTLIRSAGSGRAALERAFLSVYGIDNGFQTIQMMGRTDPGILSEALDQHGLTWKDDEVARFRKIYFNSLEEEIDQDREGKRICAGIPELLNRLSERTDAVLALLTGNWRQSSTIKLRHFGLDSYFRFGAFGDDSPRREELVPVAVERFSKTFHSTPRQEDVYVIGDTPLDIHCAKPHGARTVAVATGFHTIEQLMLENPDYLFADFSDTDAVLTVLMGSVPG